MEKDTEEKGFVVKDRRMFDESGGVRKAKVGESEEEKIIEKDQPTKREAEAKETLSEINFSSFLLSLSTSAMCHFGDFPDPVSQKTKKDIAAAKQTIDILNMLKEKTKDNLDDREKELLDGLLFELRMRYVKEKGSK